MNFQNSGAVCRGNAPSSLRSRDDGFSRASLSTSLRGALATKIPWGWIAAKSDARLRLLKTHHWRQPMLHDHPSVGPTAILTQFGAIFVSLELSRSKWVVTSLSPGNGERMSQYSLTAGDIGGLLARFADFKRKARERTGSDYPVITIHEAGLDGFWVHRVLRK